MQFDSLRIFCEVARLASFSRAARANRISQSSASQVVHQLEDRLGVRLIDRSRRPLVLTPYGKVYYHGCLEIIDRFDDLEQRVRTLAKGIDLRGTVKVSAIYSVGFHQMARIVDRFRQQYPHVDASVTYHHPQQVLESVRRGSVDLGLLSYPQKWPDLNVVAWKDEEMVCAIPGDHPLARIEAPVPIASLNQQRYVHFTPDLPIRQAVDRFLSEHRVEVVPAMQVDSVEVVKSAVSSGQGLAILPRPTVEGPSDRLRIRVRRLAETRLVRPLVIIHRDNESLNIVAARFLDDLRSERSSPDELARDGAIASTSARSGPAIEDLLSTRSSTPEALPSEAAAAAGVPNSSSGGSETLVRLPL